MQKLIPRGTHKKWQVQSISLEKQLLCSFSSMLLQNSCDFKNQVWKENTEENKKRLCQLMHKINLLELTAVDLKAWSAATHSREQKIICTEQELSKWRVSSFNFFWIFGSIFSIGLQHRAGSRKAATEKGKFNCKVFSARHFCAVLVSSLKTKDVNTLKIKELSYSNL